MWKLSYDLKCIWQAFVRFIGWKRFFPFQPASGDEYADERWDVRLLWSEIVGKPYLPSRKDMS